MVNVIGMLAPHIVRNNKREDNSIKKNKKINKDDHKEENIMDHYRIKSLLEYKHTYYQELTRLYANYGWRDINEEKPVLHKRRSPIVFKLKGDGYYGADFYRLAGDYSFDFFKHCDEEKDNNYHISDVDCWAYEFDIYAIEEIRTRRLKMSQQLGNDLKKR